MSFSRSFEFRSHITRDKKQLLDPKTTGFRIWFKLLQLSCFKKGRKVGEFKSERERERERETERDKERQRQTDRESSCRSFPTYSFAWVLDIR